MSEIKNKGAGAGGANTNFYGKSFEEKTDNYKRLLKDGYDKYSHKTIKKKDSDFYLERIFEDKKITFVTQGGLKKYIKDKYNITLYRCPDEGYIITYNTGRNVLKILEKKEQRVEGSVETKLWAAPSLKREYEIECKGSFEIMYGLCVSGFLKKKMISNDKKYVTLNQILRESYIDVLFGDDEDYYSKLDVWINL
jgi:hypothetical protein